MKHDTLKAIGGLIIILMLVGVILAVWFPVSWGYVLMKSEITMLVILIIVGIFVEATKPKEEDE